MLYTTDAVSEAGKQTAPVKEEGCIIDRLLADIRQGTTLRRATSVRRSKRNHSAEPPRDLPTVRPRVNSTTIDHACTVDN